MNAWFLKRDLEDDGKEFEISLRGECTGGGLKAGTACTVKTCLAEEESENL